MRNGSTFIEGFIVDYATGIVDQPRLPRFKTYSNYVAVDTWTKIGINNTDYVDQGAFDAANNPFVAPVELQGNFRAADGYFAADHTSFWA